MLTLSYHLPVSPPSPLPPTNPTGAGARFLHICKPALAGLRATGLGPEACFSPASTAGEAAGDDNDKNWTPKGNVWRVLTALLLAGQVVWRTAKHGIHVKNTLEAVEVVGPGSAAVCLATSALVGMAFSVQFIGEFTRLGLGRSVGGVLALAFCRELSPVVTGVVAAGRVGSSFASELGTMQVSEQTDSLRVLGAHPVDHLVIPRVVACCVGLPLLTLAGFAASMAASAAMAERVFGISMTVVMRSARRAVGPTDLAAALVKSAVFGGIVSVVSCGWGLTTAGGAKGVGESTTSAVVLSLLWIFAVDFFLSWCFFGGLRNSLTRCL